MTDDDPVPLKAGGEASPELVRALYQLGKRGPADAARLERVAKKLEAALAEAPQPGAASEGWKLLGAKTSVTGIVIGVAALAWLGYQYGRSSGESSPPASAPQTQVAAPPVVPQPPATPEATEPALRVTPAPTEASSPRAVPQSAPRRGGRHSASSSSSGRTSGSGPSAQGSTSSGTEEAEAKVAPAPTPAAEEQVAPKPAREKQTARAEPEEPPSVPQRSEVGLLFDARKAMPSQPLAALRLLEEHAQRFPDGQLGPEREVLRIEALRKLGRTAEANERMRAFEARYPKSIHLRRLKEQAESAPSR